MAGAEIEGVCPGGAVFFTDILTGGRHQSRLGHRGSPVRMCLLEQGQEPGDMRARHGCSGDRLEQLALRSQGWSERISGQDLHPGAVTSGLMMSSEAGLPTGPLEEKAAILLPRVRSSSPSLISAVAASPLSAMYCLRARPSEFVILTDGITWLSVSRSWTSSTL